MPPHARGRLRGGTAFAYFDTSALHISSVAPSSGPLDGGTVLTLTGEGFDDLGARVAFLGAHATSTHLPTPARHNTVAARSRQQLTPLSPRRYWR